MEPSYARLQKVTAMKNGRIGMMMRLTMSSTMPWNSSSTAVMAFAFVQDAAMPSSTENTSADMTGMIWGISSWKATGGSSFRPSESVTMFMLGMMA